MWNVHRRRRGFSHLELCAAITITGILLSLGLSLYSGMRQEARLCQAESQLKQVSLALELYFKKYSSYPPQGCNLAEALGPFMDRPQAFGNPLSEELTRGECLSLLYCQPTLKLLDSPNNYLTAFVAEDGKSGVALLSGSQVVRVSGLNTDRSSYGSIAAAMIAATDEEKVGEGIKYICVGSKIKGISSLTYQATWKRLGGNKAPGNVMDSFQVGLRAKSGGMDEVMNANVTVSIHAANAIFQLPSPPDGKSSWTVGDLIKATDPDQGKPIPLIDPANPGREAGWQVELVPSQATAAGYELVCRFGLGAANEDVFHQLTRINLNVQGCEVGAVGLEGNKVFATRSPL